MTDSVISTVTSTLSGKHFINGSWTGDANAFNSFDPIANNKLDWQFANASASEIDTAAKAAKSAFVQYRAKTPTQRADFLDAIAEQLQADIELITTAANLESGLPMARVQGETGRTCNQLKLFASTLRAPLEPKFIDLANPDRAPLPKADTRLSVLPIGPVAVFGASNFPLAFSTAGGDTASALAAGCPVIVKGHPAHPATSELVTRAIEKAIIACDMPAGVFSLVQGASPQVSTDLVNHSAIKAVGFTGSLKVGRILADLCAARPEPIPFYGELGSTNPQFLLNDILSDQAESLAVTQVQSMMMGHGQFCTSPGVIIATEGAALNRYIATMSENIAALPAAAMLTPGIASTYQSQVEALVKNASVELVAQGQSAEANHLTRPTAVRVNANDYLSTPELQQEIFGPCAVIVICENKDQMLEIATELEGQLTATIHGQEAELSENQALIEAVAFNVGRIIFNQMPTGVEVCHSMNHGGPYPASTDSRTTSVGSQAMKRFERPICYQNMPESLLPDELKSNATKVISF
ncbi:aldehyde dehydrogenase (NADP(+)) [Shewanella sp. UCD-KL12]|uniref:aldehyde dehydrogenase (NADP(+)) n=1 Tax=Shewanella sp. UCD-KL12 TaxID=1917163 RepID=UPI000970880F|nr:aldehyde dehydrogenase (NADP(+)) [Shewanella sp. UCD-KL12]